MNASYTYDNLDRLTNISYSNGINASYSYDANNNLIQELRNNINTDYTYNKGGLLQSILTKSLLNDNFSGIAGIHVYTYDLGGNEIKKIKVETDFDTFDFIREETTYTYDNLDQLLTESSPNYYASYKYDTRGNRTYKYDFNNEFSTDYTYDKNNQLMEENSSSEESEDKEVIKYKYDANGNCTNKFKEVIHKNNNVMYAESNDFYDYDSRNRLEVYTYYDDNYETGYNAYYEYEIIMIQ